MNIRTLHVADIELPPTLERLRDLAYDLWWSWSPRANRLFSWIDPEHWRRYHNPVQLLINVEPQQWMRPARRPRVPPALRGRDRRPSTSTAAARAGSSSSGRRCPGRSPTSRWSSASTSRSASTRAASACSPGDHCKAASDLGVPARRRGPPLPVRLLPPDRGRRRLPAAHLPRLRLRAPAGAAGAGARRAASSPCPSTCPAASCTPRSGRCRSASCRC